MTDQGGVQEADAKAIASPAIMATRQWSPTRAKAAARRPVAFVEDLRRAARR